MSATGRGMVRSVADFYRTPAHCVEPIVRLLPLVDRVLDAGCGDGAIGKVLARDLDRRGVPKLEGVELVGAHARKAGWATVADEHGGANVYDRVVRGDFLDTSLDWEHLSGQLIIANPPFSLAMEFVQRALDIVGPSGHVWILQRLSFVASKGRRAFHREHPSNMRVLSSRPNFLEGHLLHVYCCGLGHKTKVIDEMDLDGTTICPREDCTRPAKQQKSERPSGDSADYAWFSWGPGPRGILEVL